MKFSAKTKYGLRAMVALAEYYEGSDLVPLMKLSDDLKISKIYLEQVFSLLKQHKLVVSIKGPKGGYQLAKSPKEISIYDLLSATEASLFEEDRTFCMDDDNIEKAISSILFEPFNQRLQSMLQAISLEQVVEKYHEYNFNDSFMYYL